MGSLTPCLFRTLLGERLLRFTTSLSAVLCAVFTEVKALMLFWADAKGGMPGHFTPGYCSGWLSIPACGRSRFNACARRSP